MDTSAPPPNFDPLNETILREVLTQENQDILDRAKELLPLAEQWEKAPALASDEEAQDLADFMKQVALLAGDKGSANTRREARKKPYDAAAAVVQRFFMDGVIKPFLPQMTALKAKANAWLDHKRKLAEAEQRRKAEEAKKAMEAATTAEQVKQAATLAKAAAAPVKGTVKSDFGSGMHQTSRWDFEVEDIAKVPHKFLVVDRSAVMAYIRTGSPEKPVTIEGIKVLRVTSAVGS